MDWLSQPDALLEVPRTLILGASMKITKTRNGLRLSEHGVVISELRTSAGPTHSVFDVLAACISVFAREGRIGLLGFAAGGMMAPLRGLGVEATIESVDLDRAGYELFLARCPAWSDRVEWQQADAVAWLRQQSASFELLVEDLSVPLQGDVIKPTVSFEELPALIRRRLKPRGIAVFNLLPPLGGRWRGEIERIAAHFQSARLITLDEFENRILVCAGALPTAQWLSVNLRCELQRLRSRQARRLHVRTLTTVWCPTPGAA